MEPENIKTLDDLAQWWGEPPNVTVYPEIGVGAGTELSDLLASLGFTKVGCACQRHINEMDNKGLQWCRDNIDTILGWLAESAKKRNVGYSKIMAKGLVRLAIRRARKNPRSIK